MGEDFDRASPALSFTGFCIIMTSAQNDGFDIARQSQYQDMNLSLSSYFMASSHNTYLEEDQLQGPSSVNRYIDDVIKCCRCVELDCWDGDGGEPIIYHGFTLTSKILFKGPTSHHCSHFLQMLSLQLPSIPSVSPLILWFYLWKITAPYHNKSKWLSIFAISSALLC